MPHSANSLLKALSGSVSAAYCASNWSRFGRGAAGAGGGAGDCRHGGCGRRVRREKARQRCSTALRDGQRRRPPAAAAHGSQRGWMLLPNTSPAARRTTLALTSVAVLGERAEQGAIADDVDEPRHAAREPLDLAQRAVGEHFARGAGDAQAMTHVGGGLVGATADRGDSGR